MENKNLIKVSNYAKLKNISVVWVYKMARIGKIEIVEIDDVKFVNMEKDEYTKKRK